ncbi:hypothetical protein LTR37_005710 [Vermiconidia calcicola]|uniref:Uncharacterized protein n=1 Tax=Vermiconidia calcicola TaxID=1690605 RepID=A0ACC3NIW0_9PEZI|nr:hypothetical protein LTR37_005710 [Vermiconidia calcicola]
MPPKRKAAAYAPPNRRSKARRCPDRVETTRPLLPPLIGNIGVKTLAQPLPHKTSRLNIDEELQPFLEAAVPGIRALYQDIEESGKPQEAIARYRVRHPKHEHGIPLQTLGSALSHVPIEQTLDVSSKELRLGLWARAFTDAEFMAVFMEHRKDKAGERKPNAGNERKYGVYRLEVCRALKVRKRRFATLGLSRRFRSPSPVPASTSNSAEPLAQPKPSIPTMPTSTSAAATTAGIDDIPNEEVAQALSARARKNPQLRALNKAVQDRTATPEQMTQFGVYIRDVKDTLHLQRRLSQPAATKQQPWGSVPPSVRELAKLDPPYTAPKRNAGSVALSFARSGPATQPASTSLSYFEAYSALSTLSAAALAPGTDKRPTDIIAEQFLVRSLTDADHRKFLETVVRTRNNEGENTPQETTEFSKIMRDIESTLSLERIRRGGKEGAPITSDTVPAKEGLISANIDPSVKEVSNADLAHDLITRASQNVDLRSIVKLVNSKKPSAMLLEAFEGHVRDMRTMLQVLELLTACPPVVQRDGHNVLLSPSAASRPNTQGTALEREPATSSFSTLRPSPTLSPGPVALLLPEALKAVAVFSRASFTPPPSEVSITALADRLLARSRVEENVRTLFDAVHHKSTNRKVLESLERSRFQSYIRDAEEELRGEKQSQSIGASTNRSGSWPPKAYTCFISSKPAGNIQRPEIEVSDAAIAQQVALRMTKSAELSSWVRLLNKRGPTPQLIDLFGSHVREIKTMLQLPEKVPAIKQDHRETAPPASTGRPPPILSPPHASLKDTTPHRPQAPHALRIPQAQPKHIELRTQKGAPQMHHPTPAHQNHPASSVGANFHSAPYPLSLLPYKSWDALHHNTPQGAICASCCEPQPLLPQQRKLFLVAERLSWGTGPVSANERNANEEALWSVNAELEIYDPAVEDEQIVIGGRQSREDALFPFASEQEAGVVMRVVTKPEVLTTRTWDLWRDMINEKTEGEASDTGDRGSGMVDSGRQALTMLNNNSRWLPSTDHTTRVKGKERAIIETLDLTSTSPSSTPTPFANNGHSSSTSAAQPSRIQTLQDFYSVLDELERTSPMGARFLEAYAERLRDEVCKHCWFRHNILDEEELEDDGRLASRPTWDKKGMAPLFPPCSTNLTAKEVRA